MDLIQTIAVVLIILAEVGIYVGLNLLLKRWIDRNEREEKNKGEEDKTVS